MSDEVSQFLEQVQKLRGQQIEEDEVRARELEAYLAAKRERQARREDRARSISPVKSSPANTPSPRLIPSRHNHQPSESLSLASPDPARPRSREQSIDPEGDVDSSRDFTMISATSDSPTKENESPHEPNIKRSSANASPGRSPTLSWQRRPASRGAQGSRPLSMVAAQNATQRSLAGSQETPPSAPAVQETFSRDQIAKNLESKDPTWFKQTADRGVGNAAYRKNQVEDSDRSHVGATGSQLPGMARQKAAQLPTSIPAATDGSSERELASPLPLHPTKMFEKPVESTPVMDVKAVSGEPESANRSPSPTKGMGGFVQSAMMKRSDSVKRWSVTSPPGLARADSAASSRLPPSSRPQSMYRPGASTLAHRRKESETESITRDTSMASIDTSGLSHRDDDDSSLPTSPTKTMDSRRWSPTKSSWLESALNKPESPKPAPKPYNSAQPAWMQELNKTKAERANNPGPDQPRPLSVSHKHQVSIGGLKRPTPMGSTATSSSPVHGAPYTPPAAVEKSSPVLSQKPDVSKSPPVALKHETPSSFSRGSSQENLDKLPEEKKVEPSLKPQPKPRAERAPQTPPKKDFRSNLKPRAPETAPKAPEPEFKGALGNLRRTKTQNYVAPDELKSNIMRGKAALNATGGPQKTERKDDFKDAILEKKEGFKTARAEGKGIVRNSSANVEKQVPEGLAKRAQLGRQKTGPQNDKTETPSQKSDASLTRPAPTPGPKRIASGASPGAKPPISPKPAAKSPSPESLQRVSTEPAPKSLAGFPKPRALQKETSDPNNIATRGSVSKTANGFNAGLAGLLARGPPPMATAGAKGERSSSQGDGNVESATEPTSAGPQLTHMTKGRARGPRRKAPSTQQSTTKQTRATTPTGPAATTTVQAPAQQAAGNQQSAGTTMEMAPESSLSDLKPAPLSIQQQVANKAARRDGSKREGVPPREDLPSSVDIQRGPRALPEAPRPRPLSPQKTGETPSQQASPNKLDVNRMSKFFDQGASASPAVTGQEPHKAGRELEGSKSAVKGASRPLPVPVLTPSTVMKEQRNVADQDSRNGMSSQQPLASRASPPVNAKPTFARAPSTPQTSQGSPASKVATSSPTAERVKSPSTNASPGMSPIKQASEISVVLHDFFESPGPYKPIEIDPTEILTNRPHSVGKVDTKSARMFQFSKEGKKTSIQAQMQHQLFEQDMYLCAHEFINQAGWKRSEVYLWVGDEVSQSAADDAMLFAAKEAKFLGGKLIKIAQGKETAEFMQALGGVVVVRRGSSNRYDSLAPTMLCGRRFIGQVVFDEVDMSPSVLCAGFPYLVNKGGSCCLWKGKGCDADEVSAARLIGMDLSLTGEMVEYEQGKEVDSFWGLFGDGTSVPHSADHWRLKPSYQRYSGRLFCSNTEAPQPIYEISPFSQADLLPSRIYILDAFFEMYVVVGHSARSQYAAFRNALTFAQEYAILASSMEDRPFIPIATVVLEGIPRDMKSVFRKWDDAKSPTITNAAGGAGAGSAGLKRGRSLRVVPLTQALQAFKEQ